jgi:tetratricopeptide (TPR) repeat protein
VLDAEILHPVLAGFRPASPSAALASALDAAAEARFLDLLREGAVNPSEQPIRTALRGIGLYAIGDARLACTLIRQAAQLSAPDAPVQVFHGACRAIEGSDRDAIAAWETAAGSGIDAGALAPLLIEAYLRQRHPRAEEIARAAHASAPASAPVARGLAAVHIAAGREREAIALIDARLAAEPADLDAQFLLLHALFAGWVHGGAGAAMDGKERFESVGRGYVEAKGRNASLVTEWLDMVTK